MTVTCPKCGKPARSGAKFCAACGATLTISTEPLQPGQIIDNGQYRVVRPLSKGGMGVIYLAENLRAFGRLCVIKEMLDYFDPADPQQAANARKRFEDEARTLAKLRHPGIPDIQAYFSESGHNYIVMEYVEGMSLDEAVSRVDASGRKVAGRRRAPEQIARYGVQLCEILEYLAGLTPPVVHHDIKPANIIIDKNTGSARLVDFGTAKARLTAQPGGKVGLQKSSIYGTVGYAPPEQYQGQSTPKSDVYALAATMYHLLTDDDPADHPFSFPAPSQVESILSKALERDPNRRINATGFRQALEKWLRSPRKPKPRPQTGNFRVVLPVIPDSAVRATAQALVRVLKIPEQQATIWAYAAPQAVLKARSRAKASRVTTQLKAAGVAVRMITVDESWSLTRSTARSKQNLSDKGYVSNLFVSRLGADKRCHCYVCGHEWTSRKRAGGPPPNVCPKCKAKEWSRHRLFKCRVCDHEFAHGDQFRLPQQLFPACPACGATDWLPGQAPVLRVKKRRFNLGTVRLGQSTSIAVSVSNAGGGNLRGVIRCREPWLQIEQPLTSSGKFTIPIDTRQLRGEKRYKGVIDVISNGGAAEVWFELFTQTPEKVAVSPAALDFGLVGAQPPPPQTLRVTNAGGGMLRGTVTADVAWIKISDAKISGNVTELSVSVEPEEMPSGQTLTGTIRLATNGGIMTIPVRANAQPTAIALARPLLDFGAVPLREKRRLVARVVNTGAGRLRGRVVSAPQWVRLKETHWSGNAFDLAAEVDGRRLADGAERTGVIQITSNGGDVKLRVRAVALGPTMAVEPSSLDFGALPAGWRARRCLRLTNLGLGRLDGSARATVPWLYLKRERFSGRSAKLGISIRTKGLAPGRYAGTIMIDSNGGQAQVEVRVGVTAQGWLAWAWKLHWRKVLAVGSTLLIGLMLVLCVTTILSWLRPAMQPPTAPVASATPLVFVVQPSVTPTALAAPTTRPTSTPVVIAVPTVVATTPRPTLTVPTPTPVPTASPTWMPTPHPPTATATRRPPPATPVPICPHPGVQITWPGMDAVLTGVVQIQGTANIDRFAYYKFEFRPEGDSTWRFLTRFEQPVTDGKLMDWHTYTVAPGIYWLRLVVVDQTGNYPEPCEIKVTVER
ncbi:MAG TPA: hypothetical protein EYH31_09375 [Anaerolineae bacterium]|nr:hypothetical protein [Anaerolineae bacterium]